MIVSGKERDFIIHDEKNVKGFFGEYRYLSNFHLCPVYFEGILYPSSENAYQAAKCVNENLRMDFTIIEPKNAKKLGRVIEVRKNWEEIKFDVMGIIVMDKFYRNKDLRQLLLDTGSKYLEETNYWNDKFWGVCDGEGENNLGIILMATRQFYLNKQPGTSHKLF